MQLSRVCLPCILAASLCLLACQAKVPGTYELDFEQTKVAVLKAAVANPEAGRMRDQALKMLEATRVTIRLEEGGKLESTTELVTGEMQTPPPLVGKWSQNGKKVTMLMAGDADTSCDIDGKRLRCRKPTMQTLFENYVLVRK